MIFKGMPCRDDKSCSVALTMHLPPVVVYSSHLPSTKVESSPTEFELIVVENMATIILFYVIISALSGFRSLEQQSLINDIDKLR